MRSRMATAVVTLLAALLLGLAAALAYVRVTGLSARAQPGPLEARAARVVRSVAVPRADRVRQNPIPVSKEVFEAGLAHFADHCATCHGNDGSGDTEIGGGLFPRPPDMRAEPTQSMTDGELFHVIEHGVRFTGMPAFGTGDAEGERASWELVRFIRRLPGLTPDDVARMEHLNPRSPEEIREEIEDERFLQGDSPDSPPDHTQHGGHR